MSKKSRSSLIQCINHQQLYTSPKAAERHIATGRAQWDEKHRLVFKEVGQLISLQKQLAAELSEIEGSKFDWKPKLSAGYNVMQADRTLIK